MAVVLTSVSSCFYQKYYTKRWDGCAGQVELQEPELGEFKLSE